MKALKAGQRRRDDYKEVTPFHVHVARERIRELEARGFEDDDGYIVLLMRGARIETLAKAAGEAVEDFAANVKARLRKIEDPGEFIPEAQRLLNLMARA